MNNNIIEMSNISMLFGKFKANDNVNLTIKKNEIHAIIGENGAGKSTLMSILFGLYQPTSGTIKVNGEIVEINSPLEANKLKIGMLHQHFKLIDTFTILENITLNNETSSLGFIDLKKDRKKVEKIIERYNLPLELNKKINKTTVLEQQRTEIVKLLYQESDILIFDEPTAVLTPQQIDQFLSALLNLKKLGKTIIIISHKIDELKKIADRGTILRRGQSIKTINVKKTSHEEIANLMVGKQIEPINNKNKSTKIGQTILEIDNITVKKANNHKVNGLQNFSLNIKEGEIVAIAGIEGNGQIELINAISGMQKIKEGHIFFNLYDEKNQKNEKIRFDNKSIKKRYQLGLSYVPQDRHKYGCVLDMSIWENLIMQDYYKKPYSSLGLLRFKSIKKEAKKIANNFDVRSSQGINSIMRYLSGGNQQKFIVGREISKVNSKLLVIAQPTRGLDVGAINNIYKYILDSKKQNKAILLISYELDEILNLADKVVVVNKGQKVDELPIEELNREKLGFLMIKNVKEGK